MTISLLIALIIFATINLITPGPNNLMLLSSGMNFGFRRTLPHLAGISTGAAIMLLMVGSGLMQLLAHAPQALVILKTLCLLYLLYLAWKIATTPPPTTKGLHKSAQGKPLTLLQAALFQWVNPKVWSMQIAALSLYAPSPPALKDILIVAITFGLLVYPVNSLWIVLGQTLRPLLDQPHKMRAFNIACATLLLASLYPVLMTDL